MSALPGIGRPQHRMSEVERRIAPMAAPEPSHDASRSARLDRLTARIERVGPRLEMVDSGPA